MQDQAARQDVVSSARDGVVRAGKPEVKAYDKPLARPYGKAVAIPSKAAPAVTAEVGRALRATPSAPAGAAGREAGPSRTGAPAADRREAAGRHAEREPGHESTRPAARGAGAARPVVIESVEPARPREAASARDLGKQILARAAQGGGGGRSARSLERDAIVTVEQSRVRVAVPSAFMAEYVGRNFISALRQAAAVVLAPVGVNAEEITVDVVVDPAAFPREAGGTAAAGAPGGPAAGAGERVPDGEVLGRAMAAATRTGPARRVATRDLRHRLSDFVVGDCNRIAYTAACAVAEGTAPPRFSPMFLHGPSGVGKTHLLQGLAHRAAERLGDRAAGAAGGRVRYTTAEAFTNEFVQALKTNTTDAFRRSFRDVEVLCIDDIHFLAGKNATQAEFLHTFDTLGLGGRMVVLASDEAPRDIRSLSEALTSRFLSGACIRVEPPDDATRVELIRRLAGARGLGLDDDAVSLIAERAGRPLPGGSMPSVREIEGLLTRVEAMRKFTAPGEFGPAGAIIGRSMVARALGLSTPDGRGPRRPVPSGVIIERVCRALRVDASDLMGRGRHTRVVLARALVTYLSRRLTTMSYPEIARSMARPNHSTVITAFNRVKGQMEAGQMVEGGPDLAEVTIRSLAERLEREIVAGG